MSFLAHKHYEIGYVLSHDYLTFRKKIALLVSYYFSIARHRLFARFSKALSMPSVAGYRISTDHFENFRGIVREVFLLGDYHFKSSLSKPLIIDCGGNIGLTALYFKWLYPNARLTVFEPAPENIRLLKKNLERNGIKDVRVVEAAVSDKPGTIQFWVNKARPGGSTSTREVYETKSRNGGKYAEYDVPAVLLSDYIDKEVDLLKIDIEGAEGQVIQDLNHNGKLPLIRDIIMEYHYNPKNESNNLPKLLSTLEQNGFRVIVFSNEVGVPSEILKKLPNYHFLIRAVNDRNQNN